MTELEKEAAQRLEKIIINSSYYWLADIDFDLLDAYGEKVVNSFYKEYKQKLYWENEQNSETKDENKFWIRNLLEVVVDFVLTTLWHIKEIKQWEL